LEGLLRIATGETLNFDAPLTVLIGGRLIRGQVATPETFAKHIGDQLAAIVAKATINAESAGENTNLDSVRDALATSMRMMFVPQVERLRRQGRLAREAEERTWGPIEEWDDDKPVSIDDIPDDDAFLVVAESAPISSFTMKNAEMFEPPTGWMELGTIRVAVRAVDSWWLSPRTDVR
jgi:hypothetical protein